MYTLNFILCCRILHPCLRRRQHDRREPWGILWWPTGAWRNRVVGEWWRARAWARAVAGLLAAEGHRNGRWSRLYFTAQLIGLGSRKIHFNIAGPHPQLGRCLNHDQESEGGVVNLWSGDGEDLDLFHGEWGCWPVKCLPISSIPIWASLQERLQLDAMCSTHCVVLHVFHTHAWLACSWH